MVEPSPRDPNPMPRPHPVLFDESMAFLLVFGPVALTLCVLCWVGVYWGVAEVARQHRVFTSLVPVQAQVVSADSGLGRSSFRPITHSNFLERILNGPPHEVWVSYRYTVGDVEHVSGKKGPKEGEVGLNAARNRMSPGYWSGQVILPNELDVRSPSGSSSWARTQASRYVPGKTCQAYYDPNEPARCCLFRDLDFSPYPFLLFSLAGGCFFGVWTILVGGIFARFWEAAFWCPGRPITDSESAGRRFRVAWVCSWVAVFVVGSCVALGHYFLYTPRPFELSLAPLYVPLLLVVLLAVFLVRLGPFFGLQWPNTAQAKKPSSGPSKGKPKRRKKSRSGR